MPNPIKYTTGSEPLSLKKGNFYIGNNSVSKGPTSSTGFYNGITPPTNGYVIYSYNSSLPGNLSYFSAANDTQLITYTNNLAGQSYTTVQQCFDYYYSQSDKVCVTQDYSSTYPYIVLDGLVFYVDAGVTQSYPTSGTTWTDINGLGPKNNGTLVNSPTYSSDGGGSILFDGVDDNVYVGNPESLRFTNPSFSYGCWFYWTNTNQQVCLMGKRDGGSASYTQWGITIAESMCCGPAGKNIGGCIINNGWTSGGCGMQTSLPNSAGWVYVFITISSSAQKIFLNGSLSFTWSANLTPSFEVANRSFYVGATGGETEGSIIIPFNNKIAVAQVYNRTLLDSEVLQNYNAQKGRFGL